MFIRKFSFFNVCRRLLDANTGGGTGGSGTGEGGTTGGEGTTGGSGGQGSTGGEGSTGDGTGEGEGSSQTDKTFTQADLDRVVNERLARERKKFDGVDVAEYKRLKADADAKAESEKTELQKAQDKITKAESDRQKAIDTANTRLILAEFKVLAKDANIKYVDDAYRLADLSTVEVKEDGTVEGIQSIIDSLIKDKPFLLAEVKGGTGKIDDTSKDNKGAGTTSFGKRLGETAKLENKAQETRHYFK